MYKKRSYNKGENSFYIIPTPIGNLEDITLRAINVLKSLDILYCEDKRVTSKLLSKLDINVKLDVFNEFSYESKKDIILSNLDDGLSVGLVSDAGMPGICDPGFKIIDFLKENDKSVVILPGPSAFVLPMVYLSKNDNPFLFKGFLSKKNTKYKSEIKQILSMDVNTIIYETPHRVLKTLKEIYLINKNCNVLLARELSKIYEEYIEGSVDELIYYIEENGIKGEIVLVITPFFEKEDIDYVLKVNELVLSGKTKSSAIKSVAKQYGVSKNKLYQDCL